MYPSRLDSLFIDLYAVGGTATFKSINVWTMASTWPSPGLNVSLPSRTALRDSQVARVSVPETPLREPLQQGSAATVLIDAIAVVTMVASLAAVFALHRRTLAVVRAQLASTPDGSV